MVDIFVSYAPQDRDRVLPLIKALEDESYSIWWKSRIEESDLAPEEVELELGASRAVLVVWTKNSKSMRWVREEAHEAYEQEKLIALQFERGSVPFGFHTIPAENFIGWEGDKRSASWQRLSWQLRALVDEGGHVQEVETPTGSKNKSRSRATSSRRSRRFSAIFSMLLAGGGLLLSLALDAGLLGGVFAFAAWFFLLFRTADTQIPAHLKVLAARWLVPVRDGARISVAEAFNQLFEAVFGRRHLSFRCLWRSAFASTIALGIIFGLSWIFVEEFSLAFEGSFSTLLRNAFLMTVAANIAGDYVSLGQTRLFLRWAARNPSLLPFLVAVDAILTLVIYLLAAYAAYLIFEPLFSSLVSEAYFETTATAYFLTLIPQSLETSNWWPEQWIFAFSVITTFITSVWLWLVLLIGPIAQLLLGKSGKVTWFGRLLGAERNPFTVFGLLTAILVVAVGGLISWLFASTDRIAQTRWQLIQDCGVCPELVFVPPGSYALGSPPEEKDRDEDEDDLEGQGGRPIEVNIPYAFAVGRFEVTWKEWQACVDDGACRAEKNDRGWGKGQRPVINVFWDDAKDYVEWLKEKTGRSYRLLSEAEWEYAARSGTTTRYAFGDEITSRQANFAGVRNVARTVPVGSYRPNAFGLFDMHGNVYEWVEDCYTGSYARTPRDGSAYAPTNCEAHVLRGGSWDDSRRYLRSANRNWLNPTIQSVDERGIRVARDLTD